VFELCEDLLNRIEVWRVGRREQSFCAYRLDQFARGVALLGCEVVHDDDIAGRQLANQKQFDLSVEDRASHRARDDQRRNDAGMAQPDDEDRGSTMSVRRPGDEPIAFGPSRNTRPSPSPRRFHQ